MPDAKNYHELDRRIASTKAALDGARAVAWSRPSIENIRVMDATERTLNDLLEFRYRGMSRQQRTEAAARPVRKLTPA